MTDVDAVSAAYADALKNIFNSVEAKVAMLPDPNVQGTEVDAIIADYKQALKVARKTARIMLENLE